MREDLKTTGFAINSAQGVFFYVVGNVGFQRTLFLCRVLRPDAIRIDEMAAHRRKLGQWRKKVLDHIGDPLFWAVVRVVRWVHEPTDHFNAFLTKVMPADVLVAKGNHVSQIVNGYADGIAKEYEDLLRGTLPELADTLPLAIKDKVCHLFLLLLLHHAAAFDRRVVRHFSRRLWRRRRLLKTTD